MAANEPENVVAFKTWLVQHGAHIHPDARFELAVHGFNVVAGNDVPPDATIVAIPFSLAITPELSKAALRVIFGGGESSGVDELGELSERELVCTYLCMHWIVDPSQSTTSLRHRAYIDTLPSPERLRTPLHFSAVELAAFRGSNLYGATGDRLHEWQAEWTQCRAIVAIANPFWGKAFTWDKYLTASTYLSSRAFPSTVLSESPSLVTTSSSYPVLLPGIDALNHARAHPVSWVVSSGSHSSESPSKEPYISLVIHTATPQGGELLNNYGPKPNSELILGYGFSLPNNPDDTIVLKIGGLAAASASASSSQTSSDGRWEVGRGARGAEPVWEAVLAAVSAQGDEEEDGGDEERASIMNQLRAAGVLDDMARSLHGRLPLFPPGDADSMRPDVLQMLMHYLEGQNDILVVLIAFAQEKEARALQLAHERGLDIIEEGEEEEEE
ncbi:SET domain-containing protein [Trametes meyenii]|nr:SET domain-containing protein [Trametes meyenii]